MNVIYHLNVLWNVQMIQDPLNYIMAETRRVNMTLGTTVNVFCCSSHMGTSVPSFGWEWKRWHWPDQGQHTMSKVQGALQICWSRNTTFGKSVLSKLPPFVFALIYCHLLGSKDITLSQPTPFGWGKLLERDSAVSYLQPILLAAGRMSASLQKVESGQHTTAYTTDRLFLMILIHNKVWVVSSGRTLYILQLLI